MKIKRRQEDFTVEEMLSPEIARGIGASGGTHALYRLAKRGIGTDEAIERIAAALGVPLQRVGYGGLKDTHGLTTQYITIEARGEGSLPARLQSRGVSMERVGSLPERFAASGVAGNRFHITVRGLTRRECLQIDDARRFLSKPSSRGRELRFVNYFGTQRFGSARHRRGFAARHLIEGDFEGALRLIMASPDRKSSRTRKLVGGRIRDGWGDWRSLERALPPCPERRVVARLAETGGDCREGFRALPRFIQQIVVEAYQSHLWNEIARRFIRDRCRGPSLAAPSDFGVLLFPRAAGLPEELASLVIPLPSPKTRLSGPWEETALDVLEDEGLSPSRLRVPGLRSPYFGDIQRSLFAGASAFSAGPAEADETAGDARRFKRRMRFVLPRGSYATVLLAAIGPRAHRILK